MPDAVHLAHHLAAEARKPAVDLLVTASAELVLVVVGELHDPHAELGEELDVTDAAFEAIAVLKAEEKGDPIALVSLEDIGGRARDENEIGAFAREVSPLPKRIEGFERALPKAERRRHASEAPSPQFLEDFTIVKAALQAVDEHRLLLDAARKRMRRAPPF